MMKVIALIGVIVFLPTYLFAAIATDSNGVCDNVTAGGTTRTCSFTNTAGNVLLVGFFHASTLSGADQVSGVTYNGVSMTQVMAHNLSGPDFDYLYYLLNPATGANNVVITLTVSSANGTYIKNASYSGVNTAAFPDATGTKVSGTATAFTAKVTVATANSWVAGFGDNESGAMTGTGGTTLRTGGNQRLAIIDSNAATSTGSAGLSTSWTGSAAYGAQVISMAPSGGAAATPPDPFIIFFQ